MLINLAISVKRRKALGSVKAVTNQVQGYMFFLIDH